MGKLKEIRNFVEDVTGVRPVIYKKRDDWATYLCGKERMEMSVPANFDERDDRDHAFRKNFCDRCSIAKGFSNVTLSILHECGHFMTQEIFCFGAYAKYRDNAGTDMTEYMAIPYEMIATQWAICWLNNPANRKIAKRFEKKFFKKG